ncbi:shikimate kinase [Treponema vincentii]|uniref:shikimate kinase n=1 Tax=Treponema vincentii TaxID=69710 RepID=UPI001BAE7D7A|nr:shikimate kinase [Treponema vincentii]QUY17739.1 shikimate kinase [Treponema vincentii]
MILLGLSHAGKTSVGRLLAEQLRLPFYDTDERICIRTGLTPRELCRQAGLSALHAAEAASLRECCGINFAVGTLLPTPELQLSTVEPSQQPMPLPLRTGGVAENGQGTAAENGAVIAAGGGICDNTEASTIIAAIPLRVFLYATEAVLFERLTHDALQTGYYPAFLHFLPVAQKAEAQQLFTELYVRRTELYRKSSNLIIDTIDLDCAAVAQKIVASLFCGRG